MNVDFSIVSESISATDTELQKLDALSSSAVASQENLKKLQEEADALHANTGGLEIKARANRLTNLTSHVALEQSSLLAIQGKLKDQRSEVLRVGYLAAVQVMGVRDALLFKRRQNVEAWVKEQFNFRGLASSPAQLAVRHTSVTEVNNLVGAGHYFGTPDLDGKIAALRELGARFRELRPIAEAEPGLIEPAALEMAVA